MKTFQQFIEELLTSETIMVKLIAQYEELELRGYIGTCELRTAAEKWSNQTSVNVVTAMRDITHECYKHFSNKYLAK